MNGDWKPGQRKLPRAPQPCPPVIRGSSGPLAMLCPGAIREVEVRIDREHEAGAVGTAAHEMFALHVQGDVPTVSWHAKKHGCDETELAVLNHYARKAWEDIKAEFPDPLTEVALTAALTDDVTLSGHLDLLSVIRAQRRAHICDLKAGRLDKDYLAQLMLYVGLVFASEPDVDEIDACVLWLRDSQIERYHVTRAQSDTWTYQFVQRVVEWDGVFHPGAHCAHCPRSHACPAVTALARRDLEIFSGPDLASRIVAGLQDLSDADIVELRQKAKVIQAVIDSLDEATRVVVRKRGPLDDGKGNELRFLSVEKRDIDTWKAWPVLTARFSDEEVARGVDVRLSRFKDMANDKAPPRKGAAAIRELDAALESAGAVTVRNEDQLRLMRKK